MVGASPNDAYDTFTPPTAYSVGPTDTYYVVHLSTYVYSMYMLCVSWCIFLSIMLVTDNVLPGIAFSVGYGEIVLVNLCLS